MQIGFRNVEITYDGYFQANCIRAKGYRKVPDERLYSPLTETAFEPVSLHFIPYFGFANRGESEMLVWMNYR